MSTRVLVVGGTSEIGLAIVRRLALESGVTPYLLGRDRERLEAALSELERVGCRDGAIGVVDADDIGAHAGAVNGAFERMGGCDVAVLAVGVLGAQAGIEANAAEAAEIMRVNFVGAGSLLLECLRAMRARRRGTVVVLSSVAAERPRAGNPIYGAAKAGLDSLAQGLADREVDQRTGVRVLVVRPGFVTTRMTAGLKPAPFSTTAEAVADATVRGLSSDAHTIWVPRTLRLGFAVLRHLPRALFRRLPL